MQSQIQPLPDVSEVLDFLRCATPAAWVSAAVADIESLLLDHASLELKAAQQAQKLIWKYATASVPDCALSQKSRLRLLNKMSRLAREELRHFEQVVGQIEQRGVVYRTISASRYARELHAQVRKREPGRIVDTLIVCAIIEARSCERFARLLPALEAQDPGLALFYLSLLKSESRHFADYLSLAEALGGRGVAARAKVLLDIEAGLIASPDNELRFHSGVPAWALAAPARAPSGRVSGPKRRDDTL